MCLCVQAYCTARMLLDFVEVTSKGQPELLLTMLYPSDSHLDDNPIFILCRNDPCSFTWTGESHIQQVRVHPQGQSSLGGAQLSHSSGSPGPSSPKAGKDGVGRMGVI